MQVNLAFTANYCLSVNSKSFNINKHSNKATSICNLIRSFSRLTTNILYWLCVSMWSSEMKDLWHARNHKQLMRILLFSFTFQIFFSNFFCVVSVCKIQCTMWALIMCIFSRLPKVHTSSPRCSLENNISG